MEYAKGYAVEVWERIGNLEVRRRVEAPTLEEALRMEKERDNPTPATEPEVKPDHNVLKEE